MAPDANRSVDANTLLRGGVAGAVAFLLGYVLTYAWKAPAVQDALSGVNALASLVGARTVPTWKAVGWLFFNAHVVVTRVPAVGGGDRMVNFIATSNDGSLVLLYVLVPVLLVLAGIAVARYDRADRPATGAAAGAAVTAGYLPLSVVGALAFRHAFGQGVTVAPDLVTAVAVAGVVYPAFLGALGGAIWGWLGARQGA